MPQSDSSPHLPHPALWFGPDYRVIRDDLRECCAGDRAGAFQEAMREADAMEAKAKKPFPVNRGDMIRAAVHPIEKAFLKEWRNELQKAEAREQAGNPNPEDLKERFGQYRKELLAIISALQEAYVQLEIDRAKTLAARQGSTLSSDSGSRLRNRAATLYGRMNASPAPIVSVTLQRTLNQRPKRNGRPRAGAVGNYRKTKKNAGMGFWSGGPKGEKLRCAAESSAKTRT